MADMNLTLTVDAEINNPDELRAEIAKLFPLREEMGEIQPDIKYFENLITVHTTEITEEIRAMKYSMDKVLPLLTPISGRQSLEHALQTQLNRAKQLLGEEGAEETIESRLGDVIPEGVDPMEFVQTIINNIEDMAANLGAGRSRYSKEIAIKDSIENLLAVLENRVLDEREGRIKTEPKAIWSRLLDMFHGMMKEADMSKIIGDILKGSLPEDVLSTFALEASVAQMGKKGRQDIFFEYQREGAMFRGAELKVGPDIVGSNIEYAAQMQKVGARTSDEIMAAVDYIQKNLERENLEDVVSEALSNMWKSDKEILTLLSVGAKEGEGEILTLPKYVERFMEIGSSSAIVGMIEEIISREKEFGDKYQRLLEITEDIDIHVKKGKGVEKDIYATVGEKEQKLMTAEVVFYDMLMGFLGDVYTKSLSQEAKKGVYEIFGEGQREELIEKIKNLRDVFTEVEKGEEYSTEDKIEIVTRKIDELHDKIGKISPTVSSLYEILQLLKNSSEEALDELVKAINKMNKTM